MSELLRGLPFPGDNFENMGNMQDSMRIRIYKSVEPGLSNKLDAEVLRAARALGRKVPKTAIMELKELRSGDTIYVRKVEGVVVRNRVDIDFTCGGHAYRYRYIPRNEIWIDGALRPLLDRNATIIHEYIERELMMRGVEYNMAHDYASQHEMLFRSTMSGPPTSMNKDDQAAFHWMMNVFPCIRDSLSC